ncbi:uncharacterized protein VP01_4941g1 [Puccinia sorghi]|uniref:Retrotransposon gag domain-containing protein n=1 Tax=Puccinia sorghi TaxID=27349 RepID=A0A0L6UNZ4_9BASI|nr:uncharacterized protein VP01_4941g1 [Puccinia sorghi]
MDALNAFLDEMMRIPSPPTSRPNSMVLAKPQPFNRTRGAVANSFFGHILLHTVTYPECFPTESSKVALDFSFMPDYAATWSQPYLMKVFNTEEVAFKTFLDDFNHPTIPPQTETVLAYTQEFNSHSRTIGWAKAPLMILYQHGLKENVQLAVVMSNIQFTSLRTMQAMALKAGQTIEGIRNTQPVSKLQCPNHQPQCSVPLGFPTWSTQPTL